jgi:hypothetical protein
MCRLVDNKQNQAFQMEAPREACLEPAKELVQAPELVLATEPVFLHLFADLVVE